MTVVVGYVPTDTGFLAMTEAEREARALGVAVVIVNVVGLAGHAPPTAADERDLDAVTAYLTAHEVPNSVRHVTDVTDERSVPEAILSVARDENASLIVLGLHQRSRIAKRLLGSTIESIIRQSPCPVLVVPDVDPASPESE